MNATNTVNVHVTKARAIELYNTISVMTGAPSYQLLRHRINQGLLKLWPEMKAPPAPGAPSADPTETRKLSISGREQRAIGEGLHGLISDKPTHGQPGLSDSQFTTLLTLAGVCGLAKWLEDKIAASTPPDLSEEAVGTPPEPEAAEKPEQTIITPGGAPS